MKSLATKRSYFCKRDSDLEVLKKVSMPNFSPTRLTMAEQHKLQHLLDEKTYLQFNQFKQIKEEEMVHRLAFMEQQKKIRQEMVRN